jgi:hypothetical protein
MIERLRPKSEVRQLTANEVIEIFRSLDLLVTNDDQAIAKKYNELMPRYLSGRNSTDSSMRAAVETWFANSTMLQNKDKRKVLLEIVYDQFVGMADAALQGAISQGSKEFNLALMQTLEQIAQRDCKCEPAVMATKVVCT